MPNSPTLWLALYFLLNLSLTLYNKSVLIHFPFPYTLTAIHALCGTIGTWILLGYRAAGWRGVLRLRQRNVPRLSMKESLVLFLFSILYTINIVVSNASLRLVTVPFHQVVRAATPFFTLVFSAIILRNKFKCTKSKVLSLIPVVAGVAFATYGDYYFTTLGFLLTLLGTVLAALKTIITHLILIKPSTSPRPPSLPLHSPVGYSTVPLPEKENVYYRHRTPLIPPSAPRIESESLLLSASQYPPAPYTPSDESPTPNPKPPFKIQIPKLKLTPLHLLYLLSPLAFIQTTLLAHFTGELQNVRQHLSSLSSPSIPLPIPIPIIDAAASIPMPMPTTTTIATGAEWSSSFQLSFPLQQHVHVHIVGSGGIFLRGWGWNNLGFGARGGVDPRVWLVLNGVMAFWLNVVSFNANRRVGALGMTVAANVKQVLTILLAVLIFDLTITPANALGILLTIFGGACYAAVELREKREAKVRRG